MKRKITISNLFVNMYYDYGKKIKYNVTQCDYT